MGKLKECKLSLFIFSAATLVLTFIYFPYFQNDPILKRDDFSLISPIAKLNHLSEYFEGVKNNDILDVQPLRDLSFYLDIKIHDLTGLPVFHLSNFLFFLIASWLFLKILKSLNNTFWMTHTSLLIFMCHPLMVSAIGWVSSRKHTLGLIFILLSMLQIIHHLEITKRSILFYFLGILSHQIFILYPAWCWLYLRQKEKPVAWTQLNTMFFLGLLVFSIASYKLFYLRMGNVTSSDFSLLENASRYILSLGRSVSLIFFPIKISNAYFQGSTLNLAGLPILTFFIYGLYKFSYIRVTSPWLILALAIHIPTYVAFTNDTYLYLPLICFIIVLNLIFKNSDSTVSKKKYVLPSLIILLLFMKSVQASKSWMTDKALWQYSFEQEESPFTSLMLGFQLIELKQRVGYDFIYEGARNFDLKSHAGLLRSFVTTVYTSDFSNERKIEMFRNCYNDNELYQSYYALTLIEGNEEQTRQGIAFLKPLLKDESTYNEYSDGKSIIKSARYICRNFENKEKVCQELKIEY